MANSVDPIQNAPIGGAVCSGSTLFASMLSLSVMLGNYLQQTTSADDIFRCIFFLGALRVNLQVELNYKPQNVNRISPPSHLLHTLTAAQNSYKEKLYH